MDFPKILEEAGGRVRAVSDAINVKTIEVRDQALTRIGVDPADLKKLDQVPLICAVVSLLINFLLFGAILNFSWLKATALSGGQPFSAYLSLTAVQFGTPNDPTADNKFFCEAGRHQCSLNALCAAEEDPSFFTNGLPKSTPTGAWCAAARAGATALSLLWLGFIPGLAATAFTGLYAGKDISMVGELLKKLEGFQFNERMHKWAVIGCWASLWVFLFITMTVYAAMIPDTLGWGVVNIEASFGLLRLSFVLVSIFGAILTSTLFNLWHAGNVIEAWEEYCETKLLTFKKALYLELMLQLSLYLFLIVSTVDWSGALIILAGFYLDTKNKNFLLMYLVLVTISILFDVIHAAELPSFNNMTPGESFGATLWIVIFLLKPLILLTIYAYEKYETEQQPYSNVDEYRNYEEAIAE